MTNFLETLVLSLLFICKLISADLYCKDDNGRNVDWYIVYKLPKINNKEMFSNGLKYAYISGPQINGKESVKEWKLSEMDISDSNSIISNTLAILYKHPFFYTSIQYNDQPLFGEGNEFLANAKGILAMDSKSGFWITHSIPNFPPAFNTRKYEYPSTAVDNGHIALCISFKTKKMQNIILNHLLTMRPNIYFNSQSANILKDESVFSELIEMSIPNNPFAQYSIRSKNGIIFDTLTKNYNANGYLFDQYMSSAVRKNLLVQTWRANNDVNLASDCKSKYLIQNINEMEMLLNNGSQKISAKWSFKEDQSKWAITDNERVPIICLADLDRIETHYNRGGGAICFNNRVVWKQFRNLIKNGDFCKKQTSETTNVNEYPFP